MQVSVETTDNKLERKLRIRVPADRVEKEFRDRLRSFGKRAKLKGFRPGKVPMTVLERQYGPQVREEVLNELVQSTYNEALVQESLRPAGSPRIEGADAAPGSAFEFTAIIELYPDVELKGLDGITVERTTVEIQDADVDKMIETLRRQRASWKPVDRAAANGDQVTVDFEGSLDGTVFDGGTGKDVRVVLGDGRFLKGFEDQLLGAAKGEQREFDLPFPKDYPNKDLAGNTAQFKVAVKAVSELELPPVDQEFCVAFGVEEGGVEKLKTDVRANMQLELNQRLRRLVKQQVLDGLVKLHKVELPASLVRDELQRLKMEAYQRMGAANRENQPDFPDEMFKGQAERRVTLGLLIAEIIRVHELKLDAARVRAMVHEIADGYEDPRRVIDAYNKNPQLMQGVEAMAMEEQVVDLILEHAKVTAKSATFDEVMNR